MPQRVVYLNGEYVPEREARISIFDSALMYGDMLFEMTRTFGQRPYRLREHLKRLYGSLNYAEIDCGLTIEGMERATLETIERNLPAVDGRDFQIMHNVTRGALPLYEEIVAEGRAPVVTINIFPLVRHIGNMAAQYEEGTHFVVPRQQSVPARYIDPKAKNRSRIFYKIAELQAAHIASGASALLTDERGFITEGTGNNFFMVRDGEIYTPRPHDILRGVSRQACMELAAAQGLAVHEVDLEPYDVRAADEAWFTSTTICMIPITQFEFRPVGTGRAGPIYKQLLAAWSREVGLDIAAQAREYAELAADWTP